MVKLNARFCVIGVTMVPHYFTNEEGPKKEYFVNANIDGLNLRLATSDGVFSKTAVDSGTEYLLRAVLPLLPEGEKTVIDLGCGYGVIGIAVTLRMSGYRVLMFDINAQAIQMANKNAELNGVSDRARAYISDGILAGVIADYVITNPPFRAGKQTVLKFFTESRENLKQGGKLFAVLRKQQGAESYIRAIQDIFDNCTVILKKKGYVVVEAEKRERLSKNN